MPQSFVALHYHLIFSTKEHRPQITTDFQPRLFDYIGGLCGARKSVLVAAGGTADHVHLLASISREIALADFVRDIKTNSSRWAHQTFAEKRDFDWQDGYGAFTVSCSMVPKVKAYLAGQAKHHRDHTFKAELTGLLKLHQIPFDERYLWR